MIYLPSKTIETAGTKIPIIGTNIEGSQLATMSDDIILLIISNTLKQTRYFVVISLLDDIKIINFFMFTLVSIILITSIVLFFLFFKRNFIYKTKLIIFKIKNNKKFSKRNHKFNKSNINNQNRYQNEVNIYSNKEKYHLTKQMYKLFNGSKEDKLEALNIAKKLSDKSTLNILRLGLKDMDSDIVKISAELITNFK